eukprot:TRINITY_DN10620_c0_g1_i2.p1 TRINITY_DN10620_c0_g1~~TRINITY_DN10620_c0_g1_i2.p1  ORF type:complete len:301 (-),score=28.07 TRINITY_DN10620_c0_g1_i2:23-925(-)
MKGKAGLKMKLANPKLLCIPTLLDLHKIRSKKKIEQSKVLSPEMESSIAQSLNLSATKDTHPVFHLHRTSQPRMTTSRIEGTNSNVEELEKSWISYKEELSNRSLGGILNSSTILRTSSSTNLSAQVLENNQTHASFIMKKAVPLSKIVLTSTDSKLQKMPSMPNIKEERVSPSPLKDLSHFKVLCEKYSNIYKKGKDPSFTLGLDVSEFEVDEMKRRSLGGPGRGKDRRKEINSHLFKRQPLSVRNSNEVNQKPSGSGSIKHKVFYGDESMNFCKRGHKENKHKLERSNSQSIMTSHRK